MKNNKATNKFILDQLLLGEKTVDLKKFLRIALELVDAIGELHKKNIVYKYLNPNNIILDLDKKEIELVKPKFINTDVNNNLGYMSPEQTRRIEKEIDFRTDFYSLGVILYKILTNKLPLEGNNQMELSYSHIAKKPISPNYINNNIPIAISKILMKLLKKDPDDRYKSYYGIKKDFEKCYLLLQNKGTIDEFILGEEDISDKLKFSKKIFGRNNEINEIMEIYDIVCNGNMEVIFISGLEGMGKSMLMKEAQNKIVKNGGIFISVKCNKYNRQTPYEPLIKAAKEFILNVLLIQSEDKIKRVKEKILKAVVNNGQVIIDVIPEVEYIIGKQPPVEEIGTVESENRFKVVFDKFLKAILSKENPMTIFFDDFQWIDLASLKAVRTIILDSKNKYLLVVGAYKENEVNDGHPLNYIIGKKVYNGINITNIHLNLLTEECVNKLICDTLCCNEGKSKQLSKIIYLRTGGNPFFIKMTLESMHTEGILKFDYKCNKWCWDIEAVENMPIYNSGLELIMKNIEKMPQDTKKILEIASCVGVEFDFNILCYIYNSTLEQIYDYIVPAINCGIISKNEMCRFSHNQIQLQIYNEIDSIKKKKYHLIIGRIMKNNIFSQKIEEQVFQIVNQLNRACDLIKDIAEVHDLVKLNLIAGQKTKNSAAYELALNYFRVAYSLLERQDNDFNYELNFNTIIQLAECEYINKNFQRGEELFSIILDYSRTNLEKAKIYNIKISIYTYFAQWEKAVKTGMEGLELFKIRAFKKNIKTTMFCEMLKLKFNLRKGDIFKIATKKNVCDEKYREKIELRKLLFNMSISAFVYNKNLFYLIVLKQINITLRNKNIYTGAFTHMNYGIILDMLLKKYEKAYKVGLKDLKICENIADEKSFSWSLFIFSNLTILWAEDFETTIKYLKKTYHICKECGNIACSIVTINNIIAISLLKSDNLNKLEKEVEKYIKIIQNSKYDKMVELSIYNKKFIKVLLGKEKYTILLDEKSTLTQEIIPFGKKIYIIVLKYLTGQYEGARKILKEGKIEANILEESAGRVMYEYFACLTMTELFEKSTLSEKKYYIKKLRKYKRNMKRWAESCPENFLSYYTLVKAEIYRITGKDDKVELYYDKAIKVATENKLFNNIALSSEIAGRYYKNRGYKSIYKNYIVQAYFFYKRWGAYFKLKDLENTYPEIFQGNNIIENILKNKNKVQVEDSVACSLESDSTKYDFLSIIEASQAISGEILLENLLKKLIKNLISNVGAQKGCLLLKKNDELFVYAEGTIDEFYSRVSNPIKIEEHKNISKSVINYVARTKQGLLLNNAHNEEMLLADSYVRENGIKSLLCTPIINKGKIIGIMYLENKFSSNVFSKKRLSIVNILASQAAISIQNAYLYKEIKELNAELKKTVEERTKSLKESIKYENMRTEFFANISHELRTPLNVIFSGYQMIEVLLKNDTENGNEEKIQKYMGTIKQNCYRLVRLINNLIDITKMDSGFFQLNLMNADIVNVVESITLSVSSYIESRGINLTFDTFVEEKVIVCDVDKIERIMLNLLSNAIKFTNHGGNILVKMYEKEEKIIISVKDDGIGIPKEKQKIIFDRFIQVDKSLSRNREGSGIGLSIVKSIVELHEGQVKLYSQLGEGTEFIVELPCKTLDIEDKDVEKYSYANSNKIEKIMIEFSDIYA